jgi:hypothetical protein
MAQKLKQLRGQVQDLQDKIESLIADRKEKQAKEARDREEAERRKKAPVRCPHCHQHVPPWFISPDPDFHYCFHCDRGFPYPEPGESKQTYEVRLDAWEPPKDPPAPAGGSDV